MSFPSTWFLLIELLTISDITITLPRPELAVIAKQALEVDPELSPDKIEKQFEVSSNQFLV